MIVGSRFTAATAQHGEAAGGNLALGGFAEMTEGSLLLAVALNGERQFIADLAVEQQSDEFMDGFTLFFTCSDDDITGLQTGATGGTVEVDFADDRTLFIKVEADAEPGRCGASPDFHLLLRTLHFLAGEFLPGLLKFEGFGSFLAAILSSSF